MDFTFRSSSWRCRARTCCFACGSTSALEGWNFFLNFSMFGLGNHIGSIPVKNTYIYIYMVKIYPLQDLYRGRILVGPVSLQGTPGTVQPLFLWYPVDLHNQLLHSSRLKKNEEKTKHQKGSKHQQTMHGDATEDKNIDGMQKRKKCASF